MKIGDFYDDSYGDNFDNSFEHADDSSTAGNPGNDPERDDDDDSVDMEEVGEYRSMSELADQMERMVDEQLHHMRRDPANPPPHWAVQHWQSWKGAAARVRGLDQQLADAAADRAAAVYKEAAATSRANRATELLRQESSAHCATVRTMAISIMLSAGIAAVAVIALAIVLLRAVP